MTTEKKKCKVEGCKGHYRAKGYCVRHYRKWRHGASAPGASAPREFKKSRYKTCTQEDCRKKRTPSGLCEEHHTAAVAAKKTKKEVPTPGASAPEVSTPAKTPTTEKKEESATREATTQPEKSQPTGT